MSPPPELVSVVLTRIFLFTLAMIVAVAALYALGSAQTEAQVASGPPHDPIDGASRAKLERVLPDADR